MARTYMVVGQLCESRRQAKTLLDALRAVDAARGVDPVSRWGLAKIVVGRGESPSKVGKIALPPSPVLLAKLESLLSRPEVSKTKAGVKALRMVRASLNRRRRK